MPQGYYDPVLGNAGDLQDRLGEIEDASGGKLPSEFTLALAQSQLAKLDLRKAAAVAARRFDVPPEWLLRPIGLDANGVQLYQDPITGGQITLATARLIIAPYTSKIVHQMMGDALAKIPASVDERLLHGGPIRGTAGFTPATPAADPERVAQAFQSMGALSGDINFSDALAVAVSLGRQKKLDLSLFRSNLEATSQLPGLSPLQAAAAAEQAARQGTVVRSMDDVVRMLDPTTAAGLAKLEHAREIAAGTKPGQLYPEGPFVAPQEAKALVDKGDPTSPNYDALSVQAQFLGASPGLLEGDLGRIFAFLKDRETDYVKAGQELAQSAKIPFTDSPLGYVLGKGLQIAGRGIDIVYRNLTWAVGELERPFQIGATRFGIMSQESLDRVGRLSSLRNDLRDSADIFFGRTTAAHALEGYGIPAWATLASEVLLGSKIDPLSWGLNYARSTRELAFLPTAGRASETLTGRIERFRQAEGPTAYRAGVALAEGQRPDLWLGVAHQFLYDPLGTIADFRNISAPEYLVREMDRTDPAKFYGRAIDTFRSKFVGPGINRIIAGRMWQYNQSARRLGVSFDERVQAVRDVFATGFGIDTGRLGTVGHLGPAADDVIAAYDAAATASAARLAETLPDTASYAALTTQAKRLGRDSDMALATLDSSAADLASGAPLIMEVPHLANPITRAELALRNSSLAGTHVGEIARSVFQGTPERQGAYLKFNIEEPDIAVADFRRALVRTQEFNPQQVEQGRIAMSRALDPKNPTREIDAARIAGQYETRAYKAINARFGIDEDMAAQFRAGLEKKYGVGTRQEVFRVEEHGGKPFLPIDEAPFLRSGFPNEVRMLDPVLYRRGISEGIGTWQRWERTVNHSLGNTLGPASLVKIPVRAFLDKSIQLVLHDLFLGLWKPLVVLNPRYILRVVGIEEQARFLGTVGIARRVEAGVGEGGKAVLGAGIGGYTGLIAGGIATAELTHNPLLTLAGAVAGGAVGAKFGAGAGRLLARVDQAFATTPDGTRWIADIVDPVTGEKLPGPDGELRLPRVSRLPDEGLANNITNKFALASNEPISRLANSQYAGFKWGAKVRGKDEDFLDWLYNGIAHQYGKDALGTRYLDDIAHGLTEEQSITRQLAWLRGEGRHEALALMGERRWSEVDQLKLETTVQTGVHYGRYITGGQADLARAGRDGTLSVAQLRGMPDDVLPPYVVGPLTTESVLAKYGPLKKARDSLGEWILQLPTNTLSRQPYFKSWYDQTLRTLVDLAKSQGKEITPEIAAAYREAARQVGIAQVRRIMFDFTRSSRFDELTNNLLVFFQPYAEFPVVWSRIIRQNPALLGHVLRIGKLAEESGFIRTDPDTGELTIPLSWWAGAAPILAAITGGNLRPVGQGGGWELSAPLTSFNLFAQSTISIPTGKFAGEIPIPLPSMNPLVQWGLQQYVEHSDLSASIKARLGSWLFAYGPISVKNGAGLFPPYLRYTLEAAFGEGWFKNEVDIQATHFLQLQEAMGQTPDPVLAKQQAQQFAVARAMFAFAFPAAPKIEFPTKPLEDELRSLTADPSEGGLGYQAGVEEFLRKYPKLRLLTIARTMWNETNDSPTSLPANKYAEQLLNTAGAKRFAQEHPAWVWAIIPSELRSGQFDPGTFFQQIASGQRVVLTPEQYLSNADVQVGWDAYFAERDRHQAWLDSHPLIGPTDPSYTEESLIHQQAITDLQELNRPWADAYANQSDQNIEPGVMAEARVLAADPIFTKTDTGQGLVEYLALRDKIEGELADAGLHTIRSVTADNLGITKQYEDGLAQIIGRDAADGQPAIEATHPDFATAYRLFFAGDLQAVETKGEKQIAAAATKYGQQFYDKQVTPWWEQWETLRAAIDAAPDPETKAAAYAAVRDFVNNSYAGFPSDANPMQLRWQTLPPDERTSYLVGLLGRSYQFYSRFDKSLLSDPSSPATDKLWATYEQGRSAIAQANATNSNFAAAPAYNYLEAWAKVQASKNPQFAAQIAHANQWGYTFQQTFPQLFPSSGNSKPYWSAFLDSLGQAEQIANRLELHGITDNDPRRAVLYGQIRDKLLGYVETLKETNVAFAQQWDWLEKENGSDTLMSYFMPDTWYAVGVVQK